MMNFIKILKQISFLSQESIHQLIGICSKQKFLKNEYILEKNNVCNDIYFISKGLLREYYFKEDREISEWFAFENTFCFSITSYFTNSPSNLIIQSLEDSEIIFIPREGLNSLRMSNFEIADFTYKLISLSLIKSQERMASLQFETALTRYENLLNQHKEFLQRVPLQYIASYLGVSAETLSRIRAQSIN